MIDLTGINNVNEFYTSNYLAVILENDLKDLFSEWNEKEKEDESFRAPDKKLAGLGGDYFKTRSRIEKSRSLKEQLELQQEMLRRVLGALGYEWEESLKELDSGEQLPLAGVIKKSSGAPDLWVIQTLTSYEQSGLADETFSSDPLSEQISKFQYPDSDDVSPLENLNLEDVLSKKVFSQPEPPRWIVLFNYSTITLIDRSKWAEKRYLSFDLNEIFSRREPSTLKAVAALLHRESVCPTDGLCLLDNLSENSHKHAFSVSEDLKYAVREAVELLGNEAIYYLRYKRKEAVFSGDNLDQVEKELSVECLRYLYRTLFLFYIEARPELGYAPMKSEEYLTGYSLESLRELEMVELTSDEEKNGFYLHNSLNILMKMVFNGFTPSSQGAFDFDAQDGQSQFHIFKMDSLKSHLFDPARTPLLEKVKFRNFVLQKVINLLSLSSEKSAKGKGKKGRRGRISYAQLGINQLGAVYEGLLSYNGFFAKTDLYEVKPAKDDYDPLKNAYFVKEDDLDQYDEKEKVYYPKDTEVTHGNGETVHYDTGQLVLHKKGDFIYRLAGRNREKSASFYTPEVLTQCVVKYALKELLKDKSADDILNLTVCEPAMGSGAFLNEGINQLAEEYLKLKQQETGEAIPHDEYTKEKQKVKAYIAANNVFGVDLNSVAVELAEISLWLNSIYEKAPVPWFSINLANGNSLVGARRQVFNVEHLTKKSKCKWLNEVPVRIPLHEANEKQITRRVFHFLLPDKGMCAYNNKVINGLVPDDMAKIKDWRKTFFEPFDDFHTDQLLLLSEKVDKLWQQHVDDLRQLRKETRDNLEVWPQTSSNICDDSRSSAVNKSIQQKDALYASKILTEGQGNSSAYRRLKLVMDYWCALWFWPIDQADQLPTRDVYLMDLQAILEGDVYTIHERDGDQFLLPGVEGAAPRQQELEFEAEHGYINVDALCRDNKRLKLVKEISDRLKFHHWELTFADIFADKGGFDLILGNPPWVKVEWKEGGILGEADPVFDIKKLSASNLATLREETLEKFDLIPEYLAEFTESDGTQAFLNGYQNYPLLKGSQSNLYKCFLPIAWAIGNQLACSGFLHPEGVYDDPKGGALRSEIYPRLAAHFQFDNELKLFSEVHHCTKFSINTFASKTFIQFKHMANLYAVKTIGESFVHDGSGPPEGMKDENSNWNVNPHLNRIIDVDEDSLTLFAKLYDTPGTPANKARLPVVHAKEIMSVLEKFAMQPKRLGDLQGEYFSTEMWHETNAQKDDTIKRETKFPESPEEWILSGPHFFVGNPCYKTPRAICKLNCDYDTLDLTQLADDYLPRTNYVPACSTEEYEKRTPTVPWKNGLGENQKVTDFYRLAMRGMLSQSGERTIISGVFPKGIGHIHGVQSTSFKNTKVLINATVFSNSIIADFFIKSTGRSNIHFTWENFPVFSDSVLRNSRFLTLTCLTSHYSGLWQESWQDEFTEDSWAKEDPRLKNSHFKNLSKEWHRDVALRTDYERRQALVEIDVLVSMALGLTLDELCAIYRIQFPVLRQNENDTWYDQNGRIVFTCSKGLPGVGLSRSQFEKETKFEKFAAADITINCEDEPFTCIKEMKSGTVDRKVIDDTLPGGPRKRIITYVAPFDKCDREEDYKTVWAEFERRGLS